MQMNKDNTSFEVRPVFFYTVSYSYMKGETVARYGDSQINSQLPRR
jgi:hypothetical protein